jgi:hypothetical protein
MDRIPSGLPEDRPQFDMTRHFKVIQRESSIKDENLNERIQKEGVHYGGGGPVDQPLTGSELEWYQARKGYSNSIQKTSSHSELPRE